MTIPNVLLNDGHQLPMIGLGTYQIRGGQGIDQIVSAIRDGYRAIDSATNYDNEASWAKPFAGPGCLAVTSTSRQNYPGNTTTMTTP